MPFIAEFYMKGRKLLMSQEYSDKAVENVEDGCWITAAVAGALEFAPACFCNKAPWVSDKLILALASYC